jgi:uncharacterized coiled-coil protein SlyX
MSDDHETRIGELEDKVKQQDRRILELKQENDEAQTTIAGMREWLQDSLDVKERWIEAFDMVLGDDDHYRWPSVHAELSETIALLFAPLPAKPA